MDVMLHNQSRYDFLKACLGIENDMLFVNHFLSVLESSVNYSGNGELVFSTDSTYVEAGQYESSGFPLFSPYKKKVFPDEDFRTVLSLNTSSLRIKISEEGNPAEPVRCNFSRKGVERLKTLGRNGSLGRRINVESVINTAYQWFELVTLNRVRRDRSLYLLSEEGPRKVLAVRAAR